MRLAQPARDAVDDSRQALPLRGEPLGEPGRVPVPPLDDRVGETPDHRLRGVGDHRLEVGGADRAALPRPQRQPVELVGEADGAGAHPVDQEPRGVGLDLEVRDARPHRRSSVESLRPFGASKETTSPPAFSDGLRELLRRLHLGRLLASGEDDGGVGRQRGERLDHRAGPASRSSAPRGRRADTGATLISDSAGIAATRPSASGAPAPSAGPNDSSAPAPPSRSARSRSRARAASTFASSEPAIRYAGLISATERVYAGGRSVPVQGDRGVRPR